MDRMIAYCGLVCTDCPAYKATKAGDPQALEGVAAQWREEYNAPTITAQWVACDGCVDADGRKCGHCGECAIRACAVEHAVANCAHCADYACEKLQGFFAQVPDAKVVLDEVNASL
jgi:hypothetical protein